MKYTCSMETVQQNGRFTLYSSKFLSIYCILYGNGSVYIAVFHVHCTIRSYHNVNLQVVFLFQSCLVYTVCFLNIFVSTNVCFLCSLVTKVYPWVMCGSSSSFCPFQKSSSIHRHPLSRTCRYISRLARPKN